MMNGMASTARRLLLLCGSPPVRSLSASPPPWSDAGWTTLRPIGFVESVFPTKFGCPRQGAVTLRTPVVWLLGAPSLALPWAQRALDRDSRRDFRPGEEPGADCPLPAF